MQVYKQQKQEQHSCENTNSNPKEELEKPIPVIYAVKSDDDQKPKSNSLPMP